MQDRSNTHCLRCATLSAQHTDIITTPVQRNTGRLESLETIQVTSSHESYSHCSSGNHYGKRWFRRCGDRYTVGMGLLLTGIRGVQHDCQPTHHATRFTQSASIHT